MSLVNFFRNFFLNKKDEDVFCAIAFNYHDSSVSFAINNSVVLVLEAERVFRQKKKVCTKKEMDFLICYGLEQINKKVEDVKYWSMTTFNNQYLSEKDTPGISGNKIKDLYWANIKFLGKKRNVLITNHHLSHAGIYLATNFKSSIIISCDGGGDIDPSTNNNECVAIFKGFGNQIEKQNIPTNKFITGKTYGVCSTFIYGADLHAKNPSEGKLMALAGYGKVSNEYYSFLEENYQKIERADYSEVLNILRESNLSHLEGQAMEFTNDSKDFAATVHQFFIYKRLENIEAIVKSFEGKSEAIILTGGASLNLDLNSKILERYSNYENYVAPCCDDTGQSLGSLCLLMTNINGIRPNVKLPYLGEGVDSFDFNEDKLNKAVKVLLNNGILIVHNGRSEVGPRALGNRSFIARPDSLEVKVKLSEKIKQREFYRPVAPMVIQERLKEYFVGPEYSPYMLYKHEVLEDKKEKIIGAVHIDNSARAQTVSAKDNKFIYDLINKFGEETGIYVLLNTSLNLQGEPLSNKIEQSIDIFNKIDGSKCLIYNGEILKIEN